MSRRARLTKYEDVDVELTPTQWSYLLDAGGMLLGVPFADDEAYRAAWDAHRDELMASYTRLHPGRRPRAWWSFEAPEPRRLADGSIFQSAGRMVRGIPRRKVTDPPVVFETELDYLRRLDLLTESEKRHLGVHPPGGG